MDSTGITDDERASLDALEPGTRAYELRAWEVRLRMRRDRLARLIELDAPQAVIDGEHNLIAQAEAQIRMRTS